MTVRKLTEQDLPHEALPFVGGLLLEITRRIPPALGRPPQFEAETLAQSRACVDAVRALLLWFEELPEVLEQRIDEFESVFASLLEVIEQLDNRIHRAVLQARQWVEEEMIFSRTVQEVLEEVEGSLSPLPCDHEPLRELLRRVEAKGRSDRREAGILSDQFDTAQRDLAKLRLQITQVEQRTRELRNQSLRDGLTGLWNRRAYDQRLAEEVARAQRYACPLSIAVWDVDWFKALNDAYGHRVGDLALQTLATRVLGLLRRSDFLGRYGGEEFVAILPNTNHAQALVAGEKIRASAASEPVASPAGPLAITVSVGVACFEPGDTASSLFERADGAVYRAKAAGRNRVEAGTPPQLDRPAGTA